jgi:hypothetical protein
MGHESTSDSLALELRQHAEGRQRRYVHEPGQRVQPAGTEHHVADDAVTDGSDQGQRRRRWLNGAQRVDQSRNPFAVTERPRVNVPHRLVILGPFRPDAQVVLWSHRARLALRRSARDAITEPMVQGGTPCTVP